MYPICHGKEAPHDESKNRFAEVIRQSQERRAELNNKAKKKQMEDIDFPPRDEEIADLKEETNLRFSSWHYLFLLDLAQPF